MKNDGKDMERELTVQDINILLEALEAWENREFASLIVGSIFAGTLGKENIKELIEKKNIEFDVRKKGYREISVIIQAKLFRLRDWLQVTE